MDTTPINAAVESIIAITDFSAPISQTLNKYTSEFPAGCGSIQDLLAEVTAVNGARGQLEGLLEDVITDVENNRQSVLSEEAVVFVKEKVDQSLVLLWRVEHVLSKGREPRGFEEQLVDKLEAFNREIKETKKGTIGKFDSMKILMRLERRKWLDVSLKIDNYSDQLRNIQLELALVFQVVSIRLRAPKWPLTSEEVKFLHAIYSKATRTAAKVDLSAISPGLGDLRISRGRYRDVYSHPRYESRRRFSYSSSRSRSPVREFHRARETSPGRGGKDTVQLDTTLGGSQKIIDLGVLPRDSMHDKKQASRKIELDEKQEISKTSEPTGTTSDLPAYEKCESEKPRVESDSKSLAKYVDLPDTAPPTSKINSETLEVKSGNPTLLGRLKMATQHPQISKECNIVDDDSHYLAYIIRDGAGFQIPDSGKYMKDKFGSKEYPKSPLVQDWWKTYSFLTERERLILQGWMAPYIRVDVINTNWSKSVIHLERLKQSPWKPWGPQASALLVIIHVQPEVEKDNSENDVHFRPKPDVPSSALVNHQLSISARPAPPPPVRDYQSGPPPPPPPPARPAGFIPPPPPRRPTINSTKVFDMRPGPLMDNKTCFEALQTYAMFTISKALLGDIDTWARSAIVEEQVNQEKIKKQLKKLNTKWGKPVTDKKLALTPPQQVQITKLLDELANIEKDVTFRWELEQIDTRTKRMKLVTIIVYVKRCPLDGLCPVTLHRNLETNRRRALEAPRPPPASSTFQPGGGRGGCQISLPPKVPKFQPPKKIGKYKTSGYGKSRSPYASDSYDSYDSDTGSDYTRSSRGESRHRSRRARSKDGRDEDKDVIEELLLLWTNAEPKIPKGGDDKDKQVEKTDSTDGKTSDAKHTSAAAPKEGDTTKENAKDGSEAAMNQDKKPMKDSLLWLDRSYAERMVAATKPRINRRDYSPAYRGSLRRSYSSDSGW